MSFFYVYILRSETNPERHYVGFTENLEQRLRAHNHGRCPHTAKVKPWLIKTQNRHCLHRPGESSPIRTIPQIPIRQSLCPKTLVAYCFLWSWHKSQICSWLIYNLGRIGRRQYGGHSRQALQLNMSQEQICPGPFNGWPLDSWFTPSLSNV